MSRPSSTALLPRTPTRSSRASSSEFDSAWAPSRTRRSRGLSCSDQSLMPIFLPSVKTLRGRTEGAALAYNSGLHVKHTPIAMSTTNAPIVTESAYLTLHYRLATADGTDLVTTFGSTPATLMLGQGQ